MQPTGQLPFNFTPESKFSFDNFLVSARNAELVGLLRALENSTEHCVFIWGSEGAGKSHVLQALCRHVGESVYLPMAKVRDYGPGVLDSLHHMDLVCIDDVEEILGDAVWEESLFGFYNRSREAGAKLVISAVRSPQALGFSLPDLLSRLSWGVVYCLHELDDDEKMSALEARAREKNLPLASDVLRYIYMRHPRNLRSLVGVLERLDQLSLAEKRKLTIPFVKRVMGW